MGLGHPMTALHCYALPVLWMTSGFHTMKPMGQNQARRYIRRSSPGGGTSWTSSNYSV